MRWRPGGGRSSNLEDRRAQGGGGFGGGRGLGVGGLLILLVLSFVFKTDLVSLFGSGGGPAAGPGSGAVAPVNDPDEEPLVEFVSFVLDSTQSYWGKLLPRMGTSYQPAKLVLFRNAVQSACGHARAATGPFYCPGDQKVYVDLGFYEQLRSQFGAPGDFAQAYVLAHEVGHHVQTQLGISQQVSRLQQTRPDIANKASVLLELQADCFAGMWAHNANRQGLLDPDDIEEGMRAAAAVGDDRLQKMGTGYVNPESFTHGSSEQRMTWFRRGYDAGDPKQCDTFASAN